MDSAIRAQLKKVEVVADPEIEKVFPALQRAIVTIQTTDGRELTRQLDYPKGDPRNPLTDREVEEKFEALAEAVISKAARRKVIEAVWALEKLDSVTPLMQMLKEDIG
jgi:2-methylcitrate dehydratase